MNKTLLDIHNSLKNQFVKAMGPYLQNKAIEGKVLFSDVLRIYLPQENDEHFEDITSIEFDKKENTWYVHNYITEVDLMTGEYWTPLRDMTFDELYKIAERL